MQFQLNLSLIVALCPSQISSVGIIIPLYNQNQSWCPSCRFNEL